MRRRTFTRFIRRAGLRSPTIQGVDDPLGLDVLLIAINIFQDSIGDDVRALRFVDDASTRTTSGESRAMSRTPPAANITINRQRALVVTPDQGKELRRRIRSRGREGQTCFLVQFVENELHITSVELQKVSMTLKSTFLGTSCV